jgi:hypothetical protein
MFWHYLLYGLRVRADVPVPGLAAAAEEASVDIVIRTKTVPQGLFGPPQSEVDAWRSDSRDERGNPSLRIKELAAGRAFRFLYADGCEFVVDRAGEQVWMSWPEQLSLTDALPYLRGPIFGGILRLRQVVALHASAVSVGGHAIAFMGPPGSGKSTTAAALARNGCPVLSDDVLALNEQAGAVYAQPGYPNLCLWPESVHFLYGSDDRLPRITPGWEKCYLDVVENGHDFSTEPQRLGAIYLLQERAAIETPRITRLEGHDALIELLTNVYVSYLSSRSTQTLEFGVLARLAASVPIRRVVPPDSPAHLSRLCDAILEDARVSVEIEL